MSGAAVLARPWAGSGRASGRRPLGSGRST
jgi:hypothetical protein